MTGESFYSHWVWPASGPGGIPGDIVATLVWVILAAIVTTLFYPPLRRAIEAFFKRHLAASTAELHAKLDHIIEHHPDIPPFPNNATAETPHEHRHSHE